MGETFRSQVRVCGINQNHLWRTDLLRFGVRNPEPAASSIVRSKRQKKAAGWRRRLGGGRAWWESWTRQRCRYFGPRGSGNFEGSWEVPLRISSLVEGFWSLNYQMKIHRVRFSVIRKALFSWSSLLYKKVLERINVDKSDPTAGLYRLC